MDSTDCLAVAGFGAAFGSKHVLDELDFSLAPHSITALLGPAGAGKSTLLRALAGVLDAHPRYSAWGQVRYQGLPLSATHRPRLVQQNARVMASSAFAALVEPVREQLALAPAALREWCVALVRRMGFPDLEAVLDQPMLDLQPVQQRAVAILREAVCEPALLLVDEPTADLSDYDAYVLLELLREVARTSALLVVLHSQKQARQLATHMVLLAGGRVQEARVMDDFLNAPLSEAGLQWVRTDSSAVSAPAPQDLVDANEGAPPATASAVTGGLVGFSWLVQGQIAGTPLPGVVHGMDHDLAALRHMGITVLITLTESDLPQAALQRHGLANVHLPIHDHEPPSLGQIQMLLKRMELLLAKGEVLAVHGLAGLGRTGTVLAAWWVREGLTATESLRRVRLLEPRYVQSAAQEAFLQSYEDRILQKII